MAVVEVSFPSYSLRRSVTFRALIPIDRSFVPGQETRFDSGKLPTLYMLHGYSGDQNDFLTMTDIWRYSIELGLAVIFPSGENSFYLEDTELGISHSRLVGKELVDFTRSMFPLSDRREDTYIGGISMGGYGALINGLRYPDTFSRILSMSGAYVAMDVADRKEAFDDGVSDGAHKERIFGNPECLRRTDKDPRFLMEQLVASGGKVPEIRLCCGTEDFLIEVNRKLHRYLEEHGISHVYEEGPGIHDWDYWEPRLRPGLEWLAGA